MFMFLVGVALLGFGARDVATGVFDRGNARIERVESPAAFWLVVLVADFGAALAAIWGGLWLMGR